MLLAIAPGPMPRIHAAGASRSPPRAEKRATIICACAKRSTRLSSPLFHFQICEAVMRDFIARAAFVPVASLVCGLLLAGVALPLALADPIPLPTPRQLAALAPEEIAVEVTPPLAEVIAPDGIEFS